jgi:hypothetical protein
MSGTPPTSRRKADADAMTLAKLLAGVNDGTRTVVIVAPGRLWAEA